MDGEVMSWAEQGDERTGIFRVAVAVVPRESNQAPAANVD